MTQKQPASRQHDATDERGQSQRIERSGRQQGQGQQGQQRQRQGPQRQGQQQQQGQRRGQQQQVGKLYHTRHYLPEQVRTGSIASLNQCLADTIVLQSQLKFAHWNVKGPNFYQLHELFDELAATFAEHIDTVAERATALGGQALGSVRIAAQASTLPAMSKNATDERAIVEQLADNLAALDALLYQEITRADEQNDLDTADLLNEVSRDVSKALGFLEAHLQGQPMGTESGAQQGTR